MRRHSSVGQSARFTSVRSQVRALLSPPSRAWSQTRSKRLLIFIKCTRDKAGIFLVLLYSVTPDPIRFGFGVIFYV